MCFLERIIQLQFEMKITLFSKLQHFKGIAQIKLSLWCANIILAEVIALKNKDKKNLFARRGEGVIECNAPP